MQKPHVRNHVRPSPVTRRTFLGCMSAAAAPLACPKLLLANEANAPRKVVVGAHPWVYAARQPKYDITPILPTIFADMQYAKMDGIELMDSALRPGDAVERIRKLSNEHRLPIIGASFGGNMWDRQQHRAILDDATTVVSRLAKLGGRTLGTSVGQAPGKKTPQQLDNQADILRKIIAICGDHGIVLNLHNHVYEVADNLHDLKGTMARIPDVKLGPDLNWLVRAGVDPVQFIRTYGKSIVFLHLRDQRSGGRWSEALGEGSTDFATIAGALRNVGFSGDAIIELAHEGDFQPTRPLRESLKMSRDVVRHCFGW